MWARITAALAGAFLSVGCLAPPPPIVVDTPFGEVRARDAEKAGEVAMLLSKLAPEVKAMLPGAQDRAIDVWVQEELAIYRFHERPDSVRGFTLLADEFDAKRIHLQSGGQSPWYLAHELVHALIGPSWGPLPGILEEGLGDVVAERLNPEYQSHIRAHRLLNASAFTGGLALALVYREPGSGPRSSWPEVIEKTRLELGPGYDAPTLRTLLATPRSELHERWNDIPEAFYGIAWLMVSRTVERIGLEGLHALCERASNEGRELVPIAWLEEAAELPLDALSPEFLATCFDRTTMQTALYLQPEPFAATLLDALLPISRRLGFREVFSRAQPGLRLWNDSELRLGYYNGPVYAEMKRNWQTVRALPATATAP
jgi:hypothetical protein